MPFKVLAKSKADGTQVFECNIWGRHFDGIAYRKSCYCKDGMGEYAKTQRKAEGIAKQLEDDIRQAYQAKVLEPLRPAVEETAITFKTWHPTFVETYVVGGRRNPRKPKPSYMELLANHVSAYLMVVLADVPLNEISAAHIDQIKKNLTKAGVSARAGNSVLSCLSVILKWAIKKGKLERMPLVIDGMPEEALVEKRGSAAGLQFYDFDQYETLIAGAAKVDWRVQALVMLAGDAGLRRGEIMALEQTDINHARNVITVARSEYRGSVTLPKGGRGRRVPMTDRLAKLLKANRHLAGKRVIVRDDAGDLNAKTVRIWIAQAERRAGMPVTNKIHVLRHTFCSHLAMRGAALLQIKELAGHTEVTTTQKYMHLAPGSADDAIKLLNKGHAA